METREKIKMTKICFFGHLLFFWKISDFFRKTSKIRHTFGDFGHQKVCLKLGNRGIASIEAPEETVVTKDDETAVEEAEFELSDHVEASVVEVSAELEDLKKEVESVVDRTEQVSDDVGRDFI